ncbi:MAG: hypothetical protein ACHP7P_13145 [Terriglobales bacterium]
MSLEIEEWEIWHTYTSFLENTQIDLPDTARRLVTSGIAECAMLRDGRTYWRSNGTVGSGSTIVEVDPLSGRSEFRLDLDEECKVKPQGFALEAWGTASYFLISERRVLGDDTALPAPYLRAYLGKCLLTSTPPDGESSEINLYPVLIVYESGVLSVEFRMIGPKGITGLADFISSGVNLFRYNFDRVEVSPGLAKFATRAYYQSAYKWNFIQRLRLIWLQAGHDVAVRQRTKKQADKDFAFDLAPLSGSEAEPLKSIALTIFYTAAFIVGRPRAGLAFLLRGQLPSPAVGEFWSGRPHIHLVRFRNQCKTASENEALHGSDFGRILCRVSNLDEAEARRVLPRDARLFQDYNAYVMSASSLWVWSTDGLAAQAAWMDPNRGNLIYERQVLAELLEYGYMLHRSLYHRVEKFSTTAEVIAVRREIVLLRLKMREASHSGEIRDLLESGWNDLGLPYLVSEIDALLRLRASETRSIEALRSTRVGWALTVVFGFVAVPALADQVVQPIWKLTPFHHFTNPSLTAVVSDGIAIFIVLLFLCMTLSVISSREG